MRFEVDEAVRQARPAVFAAHRDRLPDIVRYLDDVERVELLGQTSHADGSITQTHLWIAAPSAVPALLRPLVAPALLQWRQETVWSQADWTARWTIHVPALGAAVEVQGSNRYLEQPAGCRIHIGGDLAFRPDRVPQLGAVPAAAVPMVERIVVSLIVPLVKRSGAAVARWLDEQDRA